MSDAEPISPIKDLDSRTADGRFAPGWKGGPGRPAGSRPKFAALTAMIESASTEDELRGVIRKMLDLAMSGSIQAASWIFDRLYGRPRQLVELSGGLQVDSGHPTAMFDELVSEVLRGNPEAQANYAALGTPFLGDEQKGGGQ